MTDNEIKKALEICIMGDCEICSCRCGSVGDCRDALNKKSLDLINRLQARVEKCEKVEHFADKTIATLQAENERLKQPASASFLFEKAKLDELSTRVVEFESNLKAKIKAEAYKEFAEKASIYMVQFGLDAIKMFVKKKTKLDPILAMAITTDELNEMYQDAQEMTDYITKEMVGEDK